MEQHEIIEMANDAELCQCIWIDDGGEEIASLVAFAKLVEERTAAKEIERLCNYFQELEDKASSVRDKMYLSGVQVVIRSRGTLTQRGES